MPNNDKGYGAMESIVCDGLQPGQGCIRGGEHHGRDNFTGVPPTTLVHCEHPNFNYSSHRSHGRSVSQFPKLGSLQTFVNAGALSKIMETTCLATSRCEAGSFDIRTLNCDRNASNISAEKAPRALRIYRWRNRRS